eukprot:scaffold22596_cov65-Cyclotella_meneghiniana.AAC.8
MPSRKKAQGKARKEKRAAAAHSSGNQNIVPIACNHLGERNWLRDDLIAARQLFIEFVRHTFNEEMLHRADELIPLTIRTYDKYYQLNNARKDLFLRLLLATGTEACLSAANEIDLTKSNGICEAEAYFVMIQTIEVRNKYNGAYNEAIQFEIEVPLNDIGRCPREILRFFHRRNSCDCLKEIYYKLKETTKRTSFCYNCKKSVELRNLSQCQHCQVANYCSYECAVASWPNHKEECKEWRKHREPRENSESSDNSKRTIDNKS